MVRSDSHETDRTTEDGSGSVPVGSVGRIGRRVLPGVIRRNFLLKFVTALLLVSIFIGTVGVYTFTQTSAQLTDDARTEYTSLAQQAALDVADWRTERSVNARMMSQFTVLQSGDQERIQSFLVDEIRRLPDDVIAIHFVDLDSRAILASSDESSEETTLNSKEAPWVIQNLSYGDDDVFVSEATEAHGYSMVSFVSPVTDEGNSGTALVVTSNLDAVASRFSRPTAASFTQVVDSRGRVVAGTKEKSGFKRNDGFLEAYSSTGEDSPIVASGQRDGPEFFRQIPKERKLSQDYVTAVATVSGTDWVVATHAPTSYVFALRTTITTNLAVLFGTTLLGLGLVAVTFGRGTVTSLERLARKANELEAGNLGVDLTVTRQDEIGSLTASFASMRDALRTRIEEAESARKEAEVSRAETIEVNRHLENKAEEYSGVMQRCRSGDLTQRMNTDGENEAMDSIAIDFNDMIDELEKTIGQLTTFAEDVADSGDVVMASTESVRTAAADVAESVQRLSDRANSQQAKLESISTDLDDLVESHAEAESASDIDNERVFELCRDIATELQAIAETSEDLLAESETVAGATEEQAAELNEVSTRADRLKRYANPLGNILSQFETEAEHQFVFSGGPSSSKQPSKEE